MSLILGSLVNTCALFYLDSILIYLAIVEDYTTHVGAIFERLNQSKFLLVAYCALRIFTTQVSYKTKLTIESSKLAKG